MNYYNEWDKPTAAWLRELIAQGLIPQGDVDERSITEVHPGDLRGYTQCHFFAGIGGWPYALQLAGWSPDRPVWTGSCPCQPYSVAGKREGHKDERHLWPEMFRLIRECKPEHVFGEQVTGAIGHGWLDGVSADLEGEGYAVGAVVLGAHSVGAPHMRQRLYWVADSRYESKRGWPEPSKQKFSATSNNCELGQSNIKGLEGSYDNAITPMWIQSMPSQSSGELVYAAGGGCKQGYTAFTSKQHDKTNPWRWRTTINCADGKARPIGPDVTPVAHGVPARVVRVRGYGNAIVPQVAAEFVMAYMEATA